MRSAESHPVKQRDADDGVRTGQAGGKGQHGERQQQAGRYRPSGPGGRQAAADGQAEVQYAGLLEGHQQGNGEYGGVHVFEVSSHLVDL